MENNTPENQSDTMIWAQATVLISAFVVWGVVNVIKSKQRMKELDQVVDMKIKLIEAQKKAQEDDSDASGS